MRALAFAFLGCLATGALAQDSAADRSGVPSAASVHIPLVQQLLADPVIRDHVGLSENSWNFAASETVPGFGPMPSEAETQITAVVPQD
jgi:hypothetical protein